MNKLMQKPVLRLFNQDRAFYRTLLSIALPVALQNLINASLAMTDTLFVGFLGEKEIAAVSLANSPYFFLMLMVFGFQSGASVLISQYWGKGDHKAISRVIGVTFITAFTLVSVAATVMMCFPRHIMSLFTDKTDLLDLSTQYAQTVAPAYILNVFTQIYLAAHRSMENPKAGMYIFCTAMLLNTFLNWVLIFGNLGMPAMGIKGAAIATVIARAIEMCIAILYSIRTTRFRLNIMAAIRPGIIIVKDFIRYSAPVVLNESLWGLGISLFPAIYGRLGSDYVSAIAVSSNIERILGVMMFGVAASAAVMLGKEIGANAPREYIKSIANTLVAFSFVVGVVGAILLLVSIPAVLPFMPLSSDTRVIAATYISVIAALYPGRNFNCAVIVGVFRAGGDVRFALVIDVCAMWLVSLPLTAYFGLYLHLAPVVLFITATGDELIKTVLGLWRYRSGKWIHNVTRELD